MRNVLLALVLSVSLAGCGGGGHNNHPPKPPTGGGTASAWFIGPIIKGKNYSEGMPPYPIVQGEGWTFNFPSSGGVDAVIKKNPPSIVGATALVAHYTVTGGDFLASGENGVKGRVGISIQRNGDNWSGEGKYQQYRLYGQSRPLLKAGDGEVRATVWIDVGGKVVSQDVVNAVLADLNNYSVVFGGSFASHGVYATQPSTFTLHSIEVVR